MNAPNANLNLAIRVRPLCLQTRRLRRAVSPCLHSGDVRHGHRRRFDVSHGVPDGDLWSDLCHRHAGQSVCRLDPPWLGVHRCGKLVGLLSRTSQQRKDTVIGYCPGPSPFSRAGQMKVWTREDLLDQASTLLLPCHRNAVGNPLD